MAAKKKTQQVETQLKEEFVVDANVAIETEQQETRDPDEALSEIDTDKDGNIEFHEATTYFLHSRTFQVNFVALLAILIQHKFGFIIDASIQSEILIFVNVWLRTKTTKPINWRK